MLIRDFQGKKYAVYSQSRQDKLPGLWIYSIFIFMPELLNYRHAAYLYICLKLCYVLFENLFEGLCRVDQQKA